MTTTGNEWKENHCQQVGWRGRLGSFTRRWVVFSQVVRQYLRLKCVMWRRRLLEMTPRGTYAIDSEIERIGSADVECATFLVFKKISLNNLSVKLTSLSSSHELKESKEI